MQSEEARTGVVEALASPVRNGRVRPLLLGSHARTRCLAAWLCISGTHHHHPRNPHPHNAPSTHERQARALQRISQAKAKAKAKASQRGPEAAAVSEQASEVEGDRSIVSAAAGSIQQDIKASGGISTRP